SRRAYHHEGPAGWWFSRAQRAWSWRPGDAEVQHQASVALIFEARNSFDETTLRARTRFGDTGATLRIVIIASPLAPRR
ncbi:MAG: hypothetical protein OQK55_08325, partial [Thermoanaerobaculales bacterium]|nr:hypothetical protein [Thermoanaerobaculales bacterium]